MKNNKNNKGFTMVELIIVIAILAILMIALVPQFIKYVEKSRESTDLTVARSIESAVQVAVVDPENDIDFSTPITVTWDTNATDATALTVTGEAETVTDIQDALKVSLDDVIEPAASTAGQSVDFVVTVDEDGHLTTTWSADLEYDTASAPVTP